MKIERIDAVLASLRPSGGLSFTDLSHAELLHLLRCARVVAELSEWINANGYRRIEMDADGCFEVSLLFACPVRGDRLIGHAMDLDLLTAVESALQAARKDGGA